MKNSLLAKSRKAFLSVLCVLVLLVMAGTGAVLAAGFKEDSSAIGAEKAELYAFADAEIDPAEVKTARTEFDFEQGQFVYEVEFFYDGVEYDYRILASDGTVVKKSLEFFYTDRTKEMAGSSVSLEEAKKIAFEDAGVLEEEVTLTAEKSDYEDGFPVHEFKFFIDNIKYEYEIYAGTGDIHSKSYEIDVNAVINGETGTSVSGKTGNALSATPKKSDDGYIGEEAAKAIALEYAKLSEADVRFVKARLDRDDGRFVYEVKFYAGNLEYEFDIDACSGDVLEYDVDRD